MPPSEPPETEHAAAPPNASRAGAVQSRHDERQHWKRLLFEVVLLVASAALALVVNDWNNERERRQLAHRVLEELKLEVQQNRQEVDAELGYHEKMAQSF